MKLATQSLSIWPTNDNDIEAMHPLLKETIGVGVGRTTAIRARKAARSNASTNASALREMDGRRVRFNAHRDAPRAAHLFNRRWFVPIWVR